MKNSRAFSIRYRLKSFTYAWDGICAFFRAEHNALLHLIATLVIITLVCVVPLSKIEIILLVIVTGGVWVAELFNTALERMMDFISTERHPVIKQIKDLSAAAVLVMALVAFITGCIVFIPKL